jgi:hypothetical protein
MGQQRPKVGRVLRMLGAPTAGTGQGFLAGAEIQLPRRRAHADRRLSLVAYSTLYRVRQ